MNNPFDVFSLALLYILTVILLLLAFELGYRLGKTWKNRSPATTEGAVGSVAGVILGLLAFLLAFVVALAAGRFDTRKELVMRDATSIRAAAQVAMLDTNGSDGSAQEKKMKNNLRSIIEQVDRVQKRMQGLLNFAKPLEPHPVPVEVNALLDDVVETLRPKFAETAVNPRLEFANDIPKIRLDASQAEQIFMGLITNALEATPKGGTVKISTKAEPGNGSSPNVIVTVEDTGEGIPAENRQKVFEPFFTTKSYGTGIGLPLVKKFVECNGGTIRISDSISGGAKIDVTFPWQRVG